MRKMPYDRRRIRFLALWFFLCAAVVTLDQISKRLVLQYLSPIGDFPLWEGVFHLTYVENPGAAWGMLRDAPWVFMIASTVAIVAIVIAVLVWREMPRIAAVSLALIAGGGIGNMIDRVTRGSVVDFLYVKLIRFPVFNIADSFVCIGVFLLAFYLIADSIRLGRHTAATKENEEKED